MRKLNLIGNKFGRLIVIDIAENQGRYTCWKCQCECGNIVIKKTRDLRKGDTQSCGCLFKEVFYSNITIHNGKGSRLYRIWCNMKSRCYNHKLKCAKYYSDKGIKVCDEWKNSFLNFKQWALNNGYQENLTIDRINVNGNYEPFNCRWITIQEQQKNKGNLKGEYKHAKRI